MCHEILKTMAYKLLSNGVYHIRFIFDFQSKGIAPNIYLSAALYIKLQNMSFFLSQE